MSGLLCKTHETVFEIAVNNKVQTITSINICRKKNAFYSSSIDKIIIALYQKAFKLHENFAQGNRLCFKNNATKTKLIESTVQDGLSVMTLDTQYLKRTCMLRSLLGIFAFINLMFSFHSILFASKFFSFEFVFILAVR